MAGILNAVGGLGVLAATWLLALLTARLGWRLSFELIGACTFIIVVLAWLVVRDRPGDRGWPSLAEIDHAEGAPPAPPQQIGLMEGARRVVSEKYFWPVAIWFFFDCGVFFGFGGLWGGPYLMHAYGMTRAEAGEILSMIAWGMIVGSPLLGWLSDRVLKSRKKPFILCAISLVVIFGVLNLFPNGLPRTALLILFFFFSVCSSAIVVLGFTMTKELFPVEIAGTSVGTVNLFPFFGGAVFMPLLGRVLDIYPQAADGVYPLAAYSGLLLVLLGASIVALFSTFFMKETYRTDKA
jgi:sugar phosphate permease